MKATRLLSMMLFIAMLLAACANAGSPTEPGSPTSAPTEAAAQPTEAEATAGQPTELAAQTSGAATLTVMVHDSFAASEEVLRQFEQENNVKLSFVKSGDAGSTLNRAILSKGSPQADVLYGVDNTFLSRALEIGRAHV